jgi:hypothetical protein
VRGAARSPGSTSSPPRTQRRGLLDVNVSTLREHLARGLIRLRTILGVNDGC